MFLPIRDENPTRTVPVVTVLVMGVCVAVWVLVEGAGVSPRELTRAVCTFGTIPAQVWGGNAAARLPVRGPCPSGGLGWETLFTSMFLHGSWLHIIGNLWFFWIFGNNVEDAMGRGRFLLFYLLAGFIAALTFATWSPASEAPMIGASGAISAVMGAYLVLYPRARIDTFVFVIVFFRVIPLPAWLMLGYWILLQGVASAMDPAGAGGVAYAAHLGGFASGVILARLFSDRRRVQARRAVLARHRRMRPRHGWW